MPNVVYDNFYLSNEIEDQFNSHLDLQSFCTVDNTLTGTAGMLRMIHKYKATDGTEKLKMGEGNTQTITAGYTEKQYRILLAQNRFSYYDEEAMTDPLVVTTGTRHAGTDMFNTVNADIYKAFNEATLTIPVTDLGFYAFVDAAAMTDETKAVMIVTGAAKATTDTTVISGKTYYTKAGVGYVKVEIPAETDDVNPKTNGWFEIG